MHIGKCAVNVRNSIRHTHSMKMPTVCKAWNAFWLDKHLWQKCQNIPLFSPIRTRRLVHITYIFPDPHICHKSTSIILHKMSQKQIWWKIERGEMSPAPPRASRTEGDTFFVLSVLYDIIILGVVNFRHVKISDNNNIKFNQWGALCVCPCGCCAACVSS